MGRITQLLYTWGDASFMRSELSSACTPMYRWVIPGLLTIAALAVIWWLAIPTRGERPDLALALVAVLAALALMTVARFFDRAKRVWLEDDGLRAGGGLLRAA